MQRWAWTAVLGLSVAVVRPASAETPPAYEPLVSLEFSEMKFEVPLSFSTRLENVGDYPVDRQGGRLGDTSLSNEVRIGAKFDSRMALVPLLAFAEYEHDLVTGFATGRPSLEGVGLPDAQPVDHQLRKLWGRASLGPYLHAGGGVMTSHFGLGLLANDGAHGWTPGSAQFIDPRGGDRVLRGFLATGPLTEQKIFASLAYDSVLGDDVKLEGDSARQFVAALIVGRNQPHWAGVYLVRRLQDSIDGERTGVWVFDFSASTRPEFDGFNLLFETELAVIRGTTELAGAAEFPVHDVKQFGLVLRSGIELGNFGAVFDFLYASGDANLDDGVQNAFKADPNFSAGLLLFRHVLAGQSGRAPIVASDLELLGVPPDDIDRFPTRGSVSNTISFFPRLYFRPGEGVELYAGVLFAVADALVTDPYYTRLAGGSVRNSFNVEPGRYLGTEFDAGLRYRTLIEGTELTIGGEVGWLEPGPAFRGTGNGTMSSIQGGRLLLSYRL